MVRMSVPDSSSWGSDISFHEFHIRQIQGASLTESVAKNVQSMQGVCYIIYARSRFYRAWSALNVNAKQQVKLAINLNTPIFRAGRALFPINTR